MPGLSHLVHMLGVALQPQLPRCLMAAVCKNLSTRCMRVPTRLP
jgi:hypothetical protein